MLSGSLVENLITMLAYSDEYSHIIRNSIPINLWPVPYRIVANKCYEFIDQLKVPPKDHVSDLIEDKISKDDGEATIFRNILTNMKVTSIEGINSEYVMKRLDLFIRRQSLRNISVDLTRALQRDTEESIDEADKLIAQARKSQHTLFDPGTRLSDKDKALSFLDFGTDSFPTGIPELDKRGFGPTRKEMWLGIGDAKSGKSMLLIHLAKMAILNRLKVAHITLEMSEGRVSQRYYQTLYAIAKRPDVAEVIKLKKDANGDLIEFGPIKITPKLTLQDPNIRKSLEKLIDKGKLRHLDNIYIKQYPTGSLTTSTLNGYLDSLELMHKFQPDMVIVDYPDLMKIDKDNFRLGIDGIYKELRGLAVERNLAMVVVSQSNRLASKKKIVGSDSVAEAYSKVQHCDVILTLSATAAEKRLGLARLFVTNARNDEGNLQLIISQNYRTSTFAVDTAVMSPKYWDLLPSEEEET